MREVMYKSAGKDETLINRRRGTSYPLRNKGREKRNWIFTLHQTQKSILGGLET